MQLYIAMDKAHFKNGSLIECLKWSEHRVLFSPEAIIKILKARPNEKNAVIHYEVAIDGIRCISGGRVIPMSKIKRIIKRA
tara:strand:- start:84 stop:326 length:243 start_codon:yes stop_codon:yes gene_type:complete